MQIAANLLYDSFTRRVYTNGAKCQVALKQVEK